MQHASREKTLFSWSLRSMQAWRGFAKPFAKLPNMCGEGGFLPSCHILPSRLSNCLRGVLSVFAKNQGCQLYLPNFWSNLQEFAISTRHPSFFGKSKKRRLQKFGIHLVKLRNLANLTPSMRKYTRSPWLGISISATERHARRPVALLLPRARRRSISLSRACARRSPLLLC